MIKPNLLSDSQKKVKEFLESDPDRVTSSHAFIGYFHGRRETKTFWSNKSGFNEGKDKLNVFINQAERMILNFNHLHRMRQSQKNGKVYEPFERIEVFRFFDDSTDGILVAVLYNPSYYPTQTYRLFGYLSMNQPAINRLDRQYERISKDILETEIQRKYAKFNEKEDFNMKRNFLNYKDFISHIYTLYARYPSRSLIDDYRRNYIISYYHDEAIKLGYVKEDPKEQPVFGNAMALISAFASSKTTYQQ